MNYKEIKEKATALRNNPTESEKILWKYLRRKQLNNRRFLRQHPIIHEIAHNKLFYYIPDFYCSAEKLAIELDGKIHEFRKEKDRRKDEILNAKGIYVLRIKNTELEDINSVLDKIQSCFKQNITKKT